MRLYLDTNIYNQLLDDPAMDSIVAVLADGPHEIYVSTLNMFEMAATSEPQRRELLLNCAYRLRRQNLPLDFPPYLLRRSLKRFLEGRNDFSASIRPESGNILELIREPGRLEAKWQPAVVEWKRNQEAWYDGMHRAARDGLQRLIRDLPPMDVQTITASAHSFIRHFCDRPEFLEDFFANVFDHLGYGDTLRGRATEILCSVSVWCFYFKALAYGVYDRTIKQEHYGRASNPGSIDVQQMIYLACVDCFATDDKRLLDVARELVGAFHPEKRVISYEELKTELENKASPLGS